MLLFFIPISTTSNSTQMKATKKSEICRRRRRSEAEDNHFNKNIKALAPERL